MRDCFCDCPVSESRHIECFVAVLVPCSFETTTMIKPETSYFTLGGFFTGRFLSKESWFQAGRQAMRIKWCIDDIRFVMGRELPLFPLATAQNLVLFRKKRMVVAVLIKYPSTTLRGIHGKCRKSFFARGLIGLQPTKGCIDILPANPHAIHLYAVCRVWPSVCENELEEMKILVKERLPKALEKSEQRKKVIRPRVKRNTVNMRNGYPA